MPCINDILRCLLQLTWDVMTPVTSISDRVAGASSRKFRGLLATFIIKRHTEFQEEV